MPDESVSARQRAAVTNDPARARASRRTPAGRRLADLIEGYSAALGHPTDLIVQAQILEAAELRVAAEQARVKLLEGAGNSNEVVRLSHTLERIERRLNLKPGGHEPPPMDPLEYERLYLLGDQARDQHDQQEGNDQ